MARRARAAPVRVAQTTPLFEEERGYLSEEEWPLCNAIGIPDRLRVMSERNRCAFAWNYKLSKYSQGKN